jgi:hypothetical protein
MTARRRAGETRKNPFAAGFSVPAGSVVPEAVPDEPVTVPAPAAEGEGQAAPPAAEPQPTVKKAPTVKYTVNLDYETAGYFDELASVARRKLYRQVDKSDILKVLIRLAADDASLRDQVISEVAKQS